jgi:lipoprotein-anchoring transpeptidase ErfK/SrfK
LRTSTSLVVIAFALAGSAGNAAAQYYPPPPGYYPPPPPYAGPPPVYQEPYAAAPRPYFAPQSVPSDDGGIMRPPADIAVGPYSPDVTGSVRGPVASYPSAPSGRPTVVASLPPEEQPDQGPATELPPQFRRQIVDYATMEPPGTIVIDTPHTYLYLVLGDRKAMRYGIGVGREGFTWTGVERVSRVKEWPDWFPPKEMISRQPYLPRFMAGGDTNPLGARALYLGNTEYRIHGTNQPSTIGTFVSSGCIRLTNGDIEDAAGFGYEHGVVAGSVHPLARAELSHSIRPAPQPPAVLFFTLVFRRLKLMLPCGLCGVRKSLAAIRRRCNA